MMNSSGSSRDTSCWPQNAPLDFAKLRTLLSVALLCDALDAAGWNRQSPRLDLRRWTGNDELLLGRSKTTLWADMAHLDPEPYRLELMAVDSCRPGDVLVCAACGSNRSGIWGELLSNAARNRGCVGAIVDGAVRDVAKMHAMQFPVFARGACPYDSRNRQRVIDVDVAVELDGILIQPGDLIAADSDGVVIVPKVVEAQVVQAATDKALAEDQVRNAIRQGMTAGEAFEKYRVL